MDPRVRELIDDQLFEFFWDAAKHFGTTDLVITFDTEAEVDPIQASAREQLIAAPDAPDFIRQTFAAPASEQAPELKGTGAAAFWLLAFFPESEGVAVAVNAQRVGESSPPA